MAGSLFMHKHFMHRHFTWSRYSSYICWCTASTKCHCSACHVSLTWHMSKRYSEVWFGAPNSHRHQLHTLY